MPNFNLIENSTEYNYIMKISAAFDGNGELRSICRIDNEGNVHYNCNILKALYYQFVDIWERRTQYLESEKFNKIDQNYTKFFEKYQQIKQNPIKEQDRRLSDIILSKPSSTALNGQLSLLKKQSPAIYQSFMAWAATLFPEVKLPYLELHPYQDLLTQACSLMVKSPQLAKELMTLTEKQVTLLQKLMRFGQKEGETQLHEILKISKGNREFIQKLLLSSLNESQGQLLNIVSQNQKLANTLLDQSAEHSELIEDALLHFIVNDEERITFLQMIVEHPELAEQLKFITTHSTKKFMKNSPPFFSLYAKNPTLACQLLQTLYLHDELLERIADFCLKGLGKAAPISIDSLNILYELIQEDSRGKAISDQLAHLVELGAVYHNIVNGLLSLIKNKQVDLVIPLLDASLSGKVNLVEEILDLLQSPSLLTHKMVNLLAAQDFSHVEKLLQLSKSQDPLAQWLIQEITNDNTATGLSSLHKGLIYLLSQDRTKELMRMQAIFRIKESERTASQQLLLNLVSHQNMNLYDKLEQAEEDFLNEVSLLPSQTLEEQNIIEQITDLHRILQSSLEFPLESSELAFCLHLVRQQPEQIKSNAKIIGNILYLMINSEDLQNNILDLNDLQKTQSQLENLVDQRLSQIGKFLEQLDFKDFTIGEQHHAYMLVLNSLISQILIPKEGIFNLALIDPIKQFLLVLPSLPFSVENEKPFYCHHIERILDQLQSDEEMRKILSHIQAPEAHSPSNKIIKEQLDLEEDQVVDQQEAQQAVLSALLTPLRQGQVGSCFGTSIAIEIQVNHLKGMLQDLKSLVEQGLLIRTIDNIKTHFPFLGAKASKKGPYHLQHLLLRAWEYSISNMAESRESSLIKKRSISTSTRIIKEALTEIKLPKEEANQLIDEIGEGLFKRMTFLYDANLQAPQIAADGHSTQGAWVLYDTTHSPNPKDWKRINDLEEAIDFILNALKEIPFEDAEKGHDLIEYLSQDNRIAKGLVYRYGVDVQNKTLEELKQDAKNLDDSLWGYFTGNSPDRIIHTYFELKTPPATKKIIPKTAKRALEFCLETIDTLPPSLQSQSYIPITIPLHALSLMPHHPSIQEIQEKGGIPFMIDQGRQFEKQPLETVNYKLIQSCCKYCRELKPSTKTQLPALMEELAKQPSITIGDFIKQTKEIIQNLQEIKANELDQVMEKLIQYINPKSSFDLIEIADTNWEDNLATRSIHFGFAYSLGKGEIALYQIESKNRKLLDQEKWLGGEWQVQLVNMTTT